MKIINNSNISINQVYSYNTLMTDIYLLKQKYPFLKIGTIGKSVLGKNIPYIKLGNGKKQIMYNAGIHANEWITCMILMKFVEDFCKTYIIDGEIYHKNAKEIYEKNNLYIIPMLNPDTIDLLAGKITSNSQEYKHYQNISNQFLDIDFLNGWKANYNGVDLNLQFPAGWEEARKIKFAQGFTSPAPRDFVGVKPLTEPESIALYNFTLINNFSLVLAYHTQGKEIYWQYQNYAPQKAKEIGNIFAKVSNYKLAETPYNSSFAGYKDWFIKKYDRPGYTIEAGLGKNPLPISQFDEIYRDNLGILVYGTIL